MRVVHTAACLLASNILFAACALDWSKDKSGAEIDAASQPAFDAAADRDSSSEGIDAAGADGSADTLDAATPKPDGAISETDAAAPCENECGGPCSSPLPRTPGTACTNGRKGACERSGVYACDGMSIVCNAEIPNAGVEACGDGIDNDCDGDIDESGAVDALTWYRDCDGDGYVSSAHAADGLRACTKPAKEANCAAWLNDANVASPDCDDAFAARYPNAVATFPWATIEAIPSYNSPDFDLDCDGTPEIVDDLYATYLENQTILFRRCESPVINALGCCWYEAAAVVFGCGYNINFTLDCRKPGGGGVYKAEVKGYFVCQ